MTSLKRVFQKPHMPKLENFPARFPHTKKRKHEKEVKIGKEQTTYVTGQILGLYFQLILQLHRTKKVLCAQQTEKISMSSHRVQALEDEIVFWVKIKYSARTKRNAEVGLLCCVHEILLLHFSFGFHIFPRIPFSHLSVRQFFIHFKC